MSCLFCKIVRREIPAKVALETDDVLAFHDVSPQAPTHVLVIPKKHLASLHAAEPADQALVGAVFLAAKQVAEDAGLAASGYRVVANHGDDAGQSVHHLHVHVLGGRKLAWPPG